MEPACFIHLLVLQSGACRFHLIVLQRKKYYEATISVADKLIKPKGRLFCLKYSF